MAGVREETIRVLGMHCTSCEKTIGTAVRALPGIVAVKADHVSGLVRVRYDAAKCSSEDVKKAIVGAGYDLKPARFSQLLGIVIVVGIVALLGRNGGIDIDSRLSTGATALTLFVVGALTSLHCAGMCGGIMLSQTLAGSPSGRRQALRPALLYNLGRVISYTAIGGVVGALGSAFAMTPTMKAALMLFAGLFMVFKGADMAGWKLLGKLTLRLPLLRTSHGKHLGMRSSNPLVVGLLNGLMPCGPLQTMQLFALGSGSAIKGASAMFVFALGTVPIMLLLGALSALLSRGFTQRLARFGGALVVGLGVVMFNRGLALAGYPLPSVGSLLGRTASAAGQVTKAVVENDVQTITTVADGRGYLPNLLYVQRGIPVRWIIDGQQVNSCNGQIVIPSLNITKNIKSGENVIEFTPGSDDIRFSCWMGMISGLIRVVDDLAAVDVSNPDTAAPPAGGPSCCAGGAGPQDSIYGDDITKVPTERLVKKAVIRGDFQEAVLKGIGWEFEPLVLVIQDGMKVSLTLDLTEADAPSPSSNASSGNLYRLVSMDGTRELMSVRGGNDVVVTQLTVNSPGGYVLLKDYDPVAIVESVSDLAKVDVEAIREQYLVVK
ncbi:MAG: sulfite exporter TauE/SafE family protein [Bacillota bacterium]